MSNYSFSDAVIQDLDEICEYIARSNPSAASKLFDAIRPKCKLVANFPNMGKSYEILSSNLRGFTVDDYMIFYYPREDGMDIARVVIWCYQLSVSLLALLGRLRQHQELR